jgi:lysyl-tRNA synthetase class 2
MTQSENPLIAERKKKIALWEAAGFEPYAKKYDRTHTAEVAQSVFHVEPRREPKDIMTEGPTKTIKMAGRIMNLRDMGKLAFLRLRDGTGDFQICLAKDVLGEKFKPLIKMLDLGDFIGVAGEFFKTKHGESSLMAATVTPLSKSIRPLPEKWAGLTDKEQCYRQRHLDLISNPETMNRFKIRSKVVKEIRNFLYHKDFIEIETRTLQSQAGGAMARVFETHHNALDHDFVLRISPELDLKIAMAGGLERFFEIGKCFRNEGTDPSHLQEFTMIEWYCAYANLSTNMEWMEEMSRSIVQNVLGTTKVSVLDKNDEPVEVDFGVEFPRVRFPDLLKDYAGVDMATITKAELVAICTEKYGMTSDEAAKTSRGNLLDHVYKKTARPNIIQPTFVMDYPSDVKPLARPNSDGTADCYQLLIAGWEVMNAYGELIDPQIHRTLLEEQSVARASGDDEAMQVDEEFLGAMETGMPPMTGFGMGIDRFVALITGQSNLRDVVLFPTMRPEHKKNKVKETMVSVALINRGIGMETWQELNTVAHLTAALGARQGKDMFHTDEITTKDGQTIKLNTAHAIMIKTLESNEAVRNLRFKAEQLGVKIADFTREMLETSDDQKVIDWTKTKNHDEIDYFGILVYGKKSSIEALTKQFPLYTALNNTTEKNSDSAVAEISTGTTMLYLADSYKLEASARVLAVKSLEDDRYEIQLDQTVFYPQGGGQPWDTGTITDTNGNIFEVDEVRLLPDGMIRHCGHFTNGALAENTDVKLKIDAERRLSNTKNHSAGHLVDIAAYELGLYEHIKPTKGYHFPAGSYVQYDGMLENIDEDLIKVVEAKCNELIAKDLKIFAVDLDPVEAEIKGVYAPEGKSARFVYFENYESVGCGCGGTHVGSTKELGTMTIRKIKSKKGVTKVSYEIR